MTFEWDQIKPLLSEGRSLDNNVNVSLKSDIVLFRVNQDTLAEIVRGREAREARAGDGAREERELPDRLVCVVCLGAEREVILLPCGHVCVCATCADTLLQRGDLCPVCRGPIRTVMPAYLS